MSIEHDVVYSWSQAGATGNTIKVTRAITDAVGGSLDLPVPNGSSGLAASFSLLVAKARSVFLTSDQALTLKAGGLSAVKTLTTTGSPTGGTFTLTVGGQTTIAIAYNATAAAVQSALVALSTVGAGGCNCTGGPLPTGVVATFGTASGDVTVTHTDSLTGGSTPAVAIANTTVGTAADTTVAVKAGVPLVWDSQGYFAQPFAADVSLLRVSNGSGVDATLKIRALSSN